jgi:hypothetical protein
MHIAHASDSIASRGRLITAALVAIIATLAIAVGSATSARAAGPVYLTFHSSIDFPTWSWQGTTICAASSDGRYGTVGLASWPAYLVDELIYTNPYTWTCHTGSWFGFPLLVKALNDSAEVYSY